uniref:Uncharacterized protein n=1 Tax=Meloidogyne javanica TaxID=6303 RepID=A0A915N1S5_MELJA
MKLRSKTCNTSSSRLSVSSQKSVVNSSNKDMNVKTSGARQEHQKDELISSLPSTSKSAPQLASTPLSIYGTRRSSTASTEFSPDSPGFGRVAKSNARLLNGLDLTRKSSGSSSYLGTAVVLPELKTFELSEKCSTLSKLLKTCGNGVSDSARKLGVEQQLTSLQFELEVLCAQNIDYQSTIHGEITYLTTGEYPTVNLRNRPLPIFCCVGKEEMQKLAERVKRSVPTPTTSMSLTDLGIFSSPEDDETPHILDVPHRFWTWAKEYLRHISLDYVNEYKEKMLDRFSEENIIGNYCSQNIEKGASTSSTSQQQSSKSLPSITSAISEKSSKKRKRVLSTSESSSESSASICTTPLKNNFYSERGPKGRFKKRFKKRSGRFKKRSDSFKSNEEITTPSFEQNYRGRAISFHVGSNKSEKGPTSKTLSSSQKEILVDIDCSSLITPKLVPNGLHPQRLRELFYKSRPTIETLYARVLKEYAVHEAIHKMDEADNKLYKIASKFENTSTSLNHEQKQEMQTALKEHNIQYASFHGLKK